jgi:hypothetical protein
MYMYMYVCMCVEVVHLSAGTLCVCGCLHVHVCVCMCVEVDMAEHDKHVLDKLFHEGGGNSPSADWFTFLLVCCVYVYVYVCRSGSLFYWYVVCM